MVVLLLEDYVTGTSRELWHTKLKARDNNRDGRYKEKFEQIVEEHYIALRGRNCVIMTVNSASKNSEWKEVDIQELGPDNKGMHGISARATKIILRIPSIIIRVSPLIKKSGNKK